MIYLNFAIHFWAFGSVIFFISLAMRSLFVYAESYTFTMRVITVILSFGGELIMTYYPDMFMISWFNIIFNVTGSIAGLLAAEAWAIHHKQMVRCAHLPNSIFERYNTNHSDESIAKIVSE